LQLSPTKLNDLQHASIITIGNFDGVHLGHQAILSSAREMAKVQASPCRVLALTFDPPPVAVLFPERKSAIPPQLTTLADRVRLLKEVGADDVVVIKPDKALLALSAEDFIAKLIDVHHAVGFVEGADFRFGKGRGGDMAMLEAMGRDRGFSVRSIDRLDTKLSDQSLSPISSSLIRWLIGRGRVEDATRCLGREFSLSGKIVKGDQRGRTIGIPTANLDPTALGGMSVPMDGVYAGAISIGENRYNAAISVGNKPTFNGKQLTVEAHLIGFDPLAQGKDHDCLYSECAVFHFATWLRDQYPFPSVDDLVSQLRRDIDQANESSTNTAI